MIRRSTSLPVLALVTAPVFSTALAGPPPDYGLDFVTIGHAGNRPTTNKETPYLTDFPMGAVDYEYRISCNKLSVNQYLEFANAYGTHVTDLRTALDVGGRWLTPIPQKDGTWQYEAPKNWLNYAAGTSWEVGARYCNWLHNAKSPEKWAFEDGAYDASTFQHEFPPPHQLEHLPGAKFWIPDLDEWTKAVYYDPSRYGKGREGYWQYPNSSDNELREGLPENGGETIGDLLWQNGQGGLFLGEWDLGQYPQTQTPWGLLDVSGTLPEVTSAREGLATLIARGSLAGSITWRFDDRVDFFRTSPIWSDGQVALRIAASIPSPCSGLLVLGCVPRVVIRSRPRTAHS